MLSLKEMGAQAVGIAASTRHPNDYCGLWQRLKGCWYQSVRLIVARI
jgi:hypothetical protein